MVSETQYWLDRWQEEKTPFFHLDETHPLLKKYFDDCLSLSDESVVFVPLAGKTLDLLWLREKYPVVAVEISDIAVKAFFKENELNPKVTECDYGKIYQVENLTFYQANLYDLPDSILSSISHIYDRASLIAFNEEKRPKYVSFLQQKCVSLKEWFLVSLYFEVSGYQGPPFPLSEQELNSLFKNYFTIDVIHQQQSEMDETGNLYKKGVLSLLNQVYCLRKKDK